MTYADIHIHALCGVDDGAKTEADMLAMVDAAYRDGVRWLCLTPHFCPGWFGDNSQKAAAAFHLLCQAGETRWPDMQFFLGSELRYSLNSASWLQNGLCRPLNGSRYVLVDFSKQEERRHIVDGLNRLLGAGYLPVLAHVERYRALFGELDVIRALRQDGVLLQMDVRSFFRGFGFRVQRQSRALLSAGLLDILSSDAHDMTARPPGLSAGYRYIKEKCGAAFAEAVCRENALQLLREGAVRKELV